MSFELLMMLKKGLQAYNVIYLNRQPSAMMPKTSGRTSKVRASGIRLGVVAKIFGALLISAILYENLDILNSDAAGEKFEIADTHLEPIDTSKQVFKCSGKTHCSEMSSCDEAIYYLNHCPGTITDGDGDGIPCEKQWCGH